MRTWATRLKIVDADRTPVQSVNLAVGPLLTTPRLAMSPLYEQLGVRPIINAAGTLTRLSGPALDPEVTAAMAEAATRCVRLDELHTAAGRKLAEATRAEAALVTSGAAAGLTLSAAACMARFDLAVMDRLPDTRSVANEIIVPRSHRNGYDHCLRAAGARLVEVGLAERTRDPQAWEIEAAIGPQTCAVAYFAGFSPLRFDTVVEVAHRHDLPVIVDASSALPPRANLHNFVSAGADLVCFSGGKAIRGPQASGILCGRRDLVCSAALQTWDLDVLGLLWRPPEWLIDPEIARRGVPNHGIGRGFKVGKEQIVGLLVALQGFLNTDEAQEREALNRTAKQIAHELSGLPGLAVTLSAGSQGWQVVQLDVDTQVASMSALELVARLEQLSPPVCVMQGEAERGRAGIDPFCLLPGEAQQVVAAIRKVFGK